MLGNIRDITTAVVALVIMFVALLVFLLMTMSGAELNADQFSAGYKTFVACSPNYEQTKQEYLEYDNQQLLTQSVDNLAQMREQLEIEDDCNSEFVVSGDQQISKYGEEVYEFINKSYPEDKFKLLDTVYTAPAKYYAYLGQPQDYLFYAMSEDESKLMAYVYSPDQNQATITSLWTIDEASDLQLVQEYTKNILVKYYEKVS